LSFICPPLTSFLLFSCSGPHPHLHSFPTRRSSDLPVSQGTVPPPRPGEGRQRKLGGVVEIEPPATPPRELVRLRRLEISLGLERDRKSTRLNSSHVSISYAVFCLKKKKTNRKSDFH